MRTQRRRRSISDFRYTPLVAALGAALAPQAAMATCAAGSICVTNPADDNVVVPPGSLREAILNVNASCTGSDVINFDFPNGPFVSTVSQVLPIIRCGGLTIDGGGHQSDVLVGNMAQLYGYGSAVFGFGLEAFAATPVTIKGMQVAGFTYGTAISGNIVAVDNIVHDNNTGIVGTTNSIVRSNRVFANTTGIYVAYGGETIQLNVVYDNTYGIDVENVTSGAVVNNFIGIDDGTLSDAAYNGNSTGLYLYASTVNVQSNTISNNDTGVYLDTDAGSTLQSNKIGTNPSGTSSFGNFLGIYSGSPAVGTSITGNVISGNSDAIDLDFVNGVSISGNFIGSDITGTALIANNNGIVAVCGTGVEITNNIIATSYGGNAIEFDAMTGGGKLNIVGNKIGVTGDGVTALGSNSYGVILRSSNCALSAPGKVLRVKALAPPSATDGITIANNVIANGFSDGILLSGAYNTNITGNTIVSNTGFGVDIADGLGNQILGNVIAGNAAFFQAQPKNINLGFFGGPLPNDAGDVDADGPNNGQNYPVITSVARNIAGNYTMVSFTLDSLPNVIYRIDIYGNSSATTEPGGDQLLGNTFLSVPAAGGPTAGSFAVPGVTADYFSLLATTVPASGTGETSEFSPVANVVVAPGVSVSASSIDFGNVAINTDSPTRSVTFTSNGTSPYNINSIGDGTCYGGSICYGGPFTCTTTCAEGDYAPGASCQFTATFHPPAVGSFSKTIGVCDNVTPFSRSISITGNGVVPPPVTISPPSFDFGTTLLHSRSLPSAFTIQNPGASPVSIGAVTTTQDFDVMGSTCGTTLGPGETCNANVAFVPTNIGQITGTVSVAASTGLVGLSSKGARFVKVAAAPVATSALTGTGAIEAVLNLPPAIDLGAYTAGTPAIHHLVTLTNNGNAVLSITSISATGPFLLGNGCPQNLQPGESCTLTLDFSETPLGDYTGTLTVVSNATGGSRTISLTARTVAVAAPVIRVSPLTIGFGDRLLGNSSATQRVTIANVGNAPAVLSPPGITNTDFLVTTTCGNTLAPATTCFADVSFRPVGFGPRVAQLLVNSNAIGSPASVDLSGTGCRPFSSASSRLGARFDCSP